MPFGEKSTHTCISWEAFKKRNREGSFQPPREIFPTVGWSHFTPYSVFFSICLQKPTCACAISWWRQIHGFFFPCNPSFLVQPLPRSPSPAVPIYLPPRDKQQSWDEILFFHRTPHWLPLENWLWRKISALQGVKFTIYALLHWIHQVNLAAAAFLTTKVYRDGKAVVVGDGTKIHVSRHGRRGNFAALSPSKMWRPQTTPSSMWRGPGTPGDNFCAPKDGLKLLQEIRFVVFSHHLHTQHGIIDWKACVNMYQLPQK